MSAPVLLLTGPPGSGKTTLLMQTLAFLGERAGGFYTRELRGENGRYGFEIVTLEGRRERLATKGMTAGPDYVNFGAYAVNLDAVEYVALPAMMAAADAGQIIVVDEIGPIQLLLPAFGEAVFELLERPRLAVLGTIVERPHPLAERIKAHPRVLLRGVAPDNRDRLAGEIHRELIQAMS